MKPKFFIVKSILLIILPFVLLPSLLFTGRSLLFLFMPLLFLFFALLISLQENGIKALLKITLIYLLSLIVIPILYNSLEQFFIPFLIIITLIFAVKLSVIWPYFEKAYSKLFSLSITLILSFSLLAGYLNAKCFFWVGGLGDLPKYSELCKKFRLYAERDMVNDKFSGLPDILAWLPFYTVATGVSIILISFVYFKYIKGKTILKPKKPLN